MNDICDNPKHKSHKRYIGGIMDGQINHLLYAYTDISEYPQSIGTMLRQGQRSWYTLDLTSTPTDIVYRYVGQAEHQP